MLAADDATAIAPIAKTYKDKLGRDIAGDTHGFDGATIRGVTEYDALGRVKRKSRPFFLSGGTPLWTTTDYDVLSRPVLVTEPDNTTLATDYSGLTTVGTNALGQTKTVLKDSQGQTVSVTDAEGHTASFGYDPFGNMLEARDPVGNVATSTYDRRGRRTAENDPDKRPLQLYLQRARPGPDQDRRQGAGDHLHL